MAIVYKTNGICKVHPLTSVKISLVSLMHKCGNKTEGSISQRFLVTNACKKINAKTIK